MKTIFAILIVILSYSNIFSQWADYLYPADTTINTSESLTIYGRININSIPSQYGLDTNYTAKLILSTLDPRIIDSTSIVFNAVLDSIFNGIHEYKAVVNNISTGKYYYCYAYYLNDTLKWFGGARYSSEFFITGELTVSEATNTHLPKPNHVVMVIEENHSYSQIIGSSYAPYINVLAKDSLSALFSQSYGVTHPSQPNYLWLFSGNNQGVTDDNLPSNLPFTTANLGAELLEKALTFVGYSEDLPSIGYTGATSGNYARKHSPWVNWQNASANGIPSSLNVPFTDFPTNYNNLPAVAIVIPNLINDMHNGIDPARIEAGDTWLKNNLDGYIQWAKTHNSLFILTFDEDNGSSNNRIVTLFVGQMVKEGIYNNKINHINLLRTIEDMYGLNYAGISADSSSISYCWNNSLLPVELSYFNVKAQGEQIDLNWETKTELNNYGFYVERALVLNNQVGNWRQVGFIPGAGSSTSPHLYSFIDRPTGGNNFSYRLKQTDDDGSYKYFNAINVTLNSLPQPELMQNSPNPFNPATTIRFYLPVNSEVKIEVYDLLGREVKTLLNRQINSGYHEVSWNGIDKYGNQSASGIYFYRMRAVPFGRHAGNFVETKKFILMK